MQRFSKENARTLQAANRVLLPSQQVTIIPCTPSTPPDVQPIRSPSAPHPLPIRICLTISPVNLRSNPYTSISGFPMARLPSSARVKIKWMAERGHHGSGLEEVTARELMANKKMPPLLYLRFVHPLRYFLRLRLTPIPLCFVTYRV